MTPGSKRDPVEYVMSLAQAGLAEMRALIFELRPESLENEGLVAALEKQTAAIEARHSIKISLELGQEPDCKIEAKEATASHRRRCTTLSSTRGPRAFRSPWSRRTASSYSRSQTMGDRLRRHGGISRARGPSIDARACREVRWNSHNRQPLGWRHDNRRAAADLMMPSS